MSTVHVIGAAGFSGAQLAALVDAHPHFALGQVTARADAGSRIVDIAPEYRVDAVLQELDLDGVAEGDFAAVCYPHAEAAAVVRVQPGIPARSWRRWSMAPSSVVASPVEPGVGPLGVAQ